MPVSSLPYCSHRLPTLRLTAAGLVTAPTQSRKDPDSESTPARSWAGHGGGNWGGGRFFGPGFGFYGYGYPWWWGWGYPYYPYSPYSYYPYPYYGYDAYYGDSYYGDPYYAYRDPPSSTTKWIQTALARRGYYRGPIDGEIGPGTRNAIRSFQAHQGLPVTGQMDGSLNRALQS